MSTEPARPGPETSGFEILWAKWLVLLLMAYYTVFALVAPVMNYDSQVYNVARVAIAQAGGLFGNPGWNSDREILFPWSFDAVHYPFLFLHWGYCLPSVACLIGLQIIVYRLVAAARSPRQAWWCCLALLAMPTIVFQAVCTKNDLAVVFALACWYYAWRLWRESGNRAYLLFMALALSFAAGAKTTGLPFFGGLGLFTLWQLRSNRQAAVRFAVCMAVGFVLLGSVEIYLNNVQVYHAPLGPAAYLAQNKNRDGFPGAAANFIRYCFGNLNVGIDAANPASPVAESLQNACREFLRFVGLSGDLGYRSDFGEVDANMRFLKLGWDTCSDFGGVGALALIASLIFVLARPRSDPLWRLAACGFITLALTSYTVAWMMWNARFLMLTFTLFALALTLWVLGLGRTGAGRFVRSLYLLLVVYSAFVYPLCSFNKKPRDLWLALRHRPVYETKERPLMLEIMQDLRQRSGEIGAAPVLLQAGTDSWSLCVLELRGLHVVPIAKVTAQTLPAASAKGTQAGGPVYILALNQAIQPDLLPTLTLLKKYAEIDSGLYRWTPAPTAP